MGLDIIELIMEIEERLEIRFPDDVSNVRTAGELADAAMAALVAQRAAAGADRSMVSAGCPTARAFYALRRALVDHGGLSRDAVAPRGSIASVMPALHRRRTWRHLSRAVGVRVDRAAPLHRPTWVIAVALAVTTFAFLFAALEFGLYGAVGALVGVPLLVMFVTTPLAVHVADQVQTVGHLAQALAEYAPPRFIAVGTAPSRAQVWRTVTMALERSTGVPADTIKPTDDLGRDLHLD
jgi:hypothetical protein